MTPIMEPKYFCLDCERIDAPHVTDSRRQQCPHCASRALYPIRNWINPYWCADCGHIGRPIGTPHGIRCERCAGTNVKPHIASVTLIGDAPQEIYAHAHQ